MIEFDQFKSELSSKEEPLQQLEAALDLDTKRKRIIELDRMMEEPDFWGSGEGQQAFHRGETFEG